MACSLSEPIEAIISRLYAKPEYRRGDRSGRLWWVCPFHDDRNPSLCVMPGTSHYHCFGCGAHGDAVDFVRRLNPGMTFRDAVQAIGGDLPRSPARPARPPVPAVPLSESDRPEGWQDFARGIVSKSEALLWTVEGARARSYLIRRGLREETILAARLGYWAEDEWIEGIYPDRRVWVPRGIVIPWFDGPDVVLLNVRRPEGEPKYIAVRGSRRGGLFPGCGGIAAGKPVVIVEGEFDALLLHQEIGDLVPVVTLGSAGNKPSARVKNALLGASPWIVAGDADAAGEKSADDWMARSDRCIRVAPPKEFGKDWTEAHERGLDLRAWWQVTLGRLANQMRPGDFRRLPAVPPPQPISGFGVVEGTSESAPPCSTARDAVAGWLDDWRLRWGGLANSYSAQGIPSREAEERAAIEVEAELKAAGYGPPPVTDPDPYTALWLYELNDLIESGEAARHLPPDELRRVQALLTGEPLDCETMRTVVLAVRARVWTERCRALGVPESPFDDDRWRCLSTTCLHKERWWMSAYGVVNCMNCRPPAFPGLVVAEGNVEESPVVEPDRSNQTVVDRSIPPGRWRDAFEERAAILEFEGGLPRAAAEVRAYAAVLGELRHELTEPFLRTESVATVEPTTFTH